MARFKKFSKEKREGKLVLNSGIVDNIVMLSVSEIPYVELYHGNSRTMKSNSIYVTFDKKGVNVEVGILIHYSQRVSEIVFRVQEVIRHNVESMTEYKISSVDVVIKGVKFEEIKQISPIDTPLVNEILEKPANEKSDN